MAVRDELQQATAGAFARKLRERLGAYGEAILGEGFVPGLKRIGGTVERNLLGLGTAPYDLPNLGAAVGAAIGHTDPLTGKVYGERPPMTSGEAEAFGLDYTPVPQTGAFARFEQAMAAGQADDPAWAQRSRALQIESAEQLARETGLSPIGVAGIDMLMPLGQPGKVAGAAGAFADAAQAGKRAAEGEKLLQRYGDIALLRAHQTGQKPLPDADVSRLMSRVGRLEGVGLAPHQPDPVAANVPGLRTNPPERAFEYVRMAPKYRATDPRPSEEFVEIGGKPVFFGQVRDQDLTEMVMKYLDDEKIGKSAVWYDEARKFVDDLSPNNRKLGAQLIAGWQASQRNESTSNAWRKLMNVVLEERLGEPVPMVKQAKVAKQITKAKAELRAAEKAKGGTAVSRTMRVRQLKDDLKRLEGKLYTKRKSGALAHDDVVKILGGGEISDEDIGTKLFDFLDSAYGKATRSIAGDDPRGGAPAVIDVWMKRLQGVWDDAGINKLVKQAEAAGDTAAVRRLEEIRASIPKKVRRRATPTKHEYEFMAEQVRRLAGKWSEVSLGGRSNWEPRQVQAVLWNTALTAHGDDMIFPSTALGVGDPATVGRASRTKDLGELSQAWVVASNWLSKGLGFDDATGWTATVRSRAAERLAERLSEVFFGRVHSVARKTSAEAAREGVSPNLPTVTSATGRWRHDYEPSLMAYHPSSSAEELEAYAASMGLLGRQKAVYTFLEASDGPDGLYFLRIPAERRKEVSDALLARGFEGQTVMDDGVAIMDPGLAKRADLEDAAEALGLDGPEVVKGQYKRHLDFKTRKDALARYEEIVAGYADRIGRKDLRRVIEAAREESLDPREIARGAFHQREARSRGTLSGPRAGRSGQGALHGEISERDLRARIEAGLERRRGALERRGAPDLPPAAGGVEAPRIHAARGPGEPPVDSEVLEVRRSLEKLVDRFGRTDSRNPSPRYYRLEEQILEKEDELAELEGRAARDIDDIVFRKPELTDEEVLGRFSNIDTADTAEYMNRMEQIETGRLPKDAQGDELREAIEAVDEAIADTTRRLKDTQRAYDESVKRAGKRGGTPMGEGAVTSVEQKLAHLKMVKSAYEVRRSKGGLVDRPEFLERGELGARTPTDPITDGHFRDQDPAVLEKLANLANDVTRQGVRFGKFGTARDLLDMKRMTTGVFLNNLEEKLGPDATLALLSRHGLSTHRTIGRVTENDLLRRGALSKPPARTGELVEAGGEQNERIAGAFDQLDEHLREQGKLAEGERRRNPIALGETEGEHGAGVWERLMGMSDELEAKRVGFPWGKSRLNARALFLHKGVKTTKQLLRHIEKAIGREQTDALLARHGLLRPGTTPEAAGALSAVGRAKAKGWDIVKEEGGARGGFKAAEEAYFKKGGAPEGREGRSDNPDVIEEYDFARFTNALGDGEVRRLAQILDLPARGVDRDEVLRSLQIANARDRRVWRAVREDHALLEKFIDTTRPTSPLYRGREIVLHDDAYSSHISELSEELREADAARDFDLVDSLQSRWYERVENETQVFAGEKIEEAGGDAARGLKRARVEMDEQIAETQKRLDDELESFRANPEAGPDDAQYWSDVLVSSKQSRAMLEEMTAEDFAVPYRPQSRIRGALGPGRSRIGVPPRVRQIELPYEPRIGVLQPGQTGRPRLPGEPGHTAPGAFTEDPTRKSELAGKPSMARGALSDQRPLSKSVGKYGDWDEPHVTELERGLERELAHYSYRPETVGIKVPFSDKELKATALVARPTEAEIETLKGVMLGVGDSWVKNPQLIVLGDKPLDVAQVARLGRRLAERTGFTFPMVRELGEYSGPSKVSVNKLLGGLETTSGFKPGMYGGTARNSTALGEHFLHDAMGPYRPNRSLIVLVRHGMPDAQTRFTMAHEVGHAMIGLRDKEMAAHYLVSKIGGAEWMEMYPEIVRSSREWARPERWAEAFAEAPYRESHIIAEIDKVAPRGEMPAGGPIFTPMIDYLSSGQETLADAVARVQMDPDGAKDAIPLFTKALRELVNKDPELKKRGIEMAGFGGALLLADQALRDSESKRGRGAFSQGSL